MSKRDEAIKKVCEPYKWEPVDVGGQFEVREQPMRLVLTIVIRPL